MRPLKLRISGLRSWRAEQELSFHDVDLAAVVGPTGAGKSSILEAIVYALYNATTYEGNVKSLISSDIGTVSVAFDFEADGERWRATRSTSRSNYPPAVHKFACLSDPESHPTVEGRSAVTDAVTELLGLDVEQFTSAVLLPQGRFQRLLTASPADRTAILKGVFRLDELDEVRERAIEVRTTQVLPALDSAQDERATPLPDPVAELAEARSQLDAAQSGVQKLEAVAAHHDDQCALAESFMKASETARAAAGTLRTKLAAVPSVDVALAAEADLSAREAAIDRPAALARRDTARAAVRAAEAEGRTIAALSAAVQVLANAAEALPRHADREAALVVQRVDLVATADAVEQDRAVLVSERDRVAPLTAERDGRIAAADTARLRLDVARRALGEARRAVQAEADAGATISVAEQVLAQARADATEAARTASVAEQRFEAAERILEATRLDHQAAHVAAGLAPGDECPVCHSRIPESFAPAAAPAALSGAETAVAFEREQRDRTRRAETVAATTALNRELEHDAARTAHEAAADAANVALVEAHVAGALPRADAGAIASDDSSLLAEPINAAEAAGAAAQAAAEALATITAEIGALERTLARRGKDLEALDTRIASEERALRSEHDALVEAIDALPALVRPASLAPGAVAAAKAAAAHELSDIQALDEAHDATVEQLDAIDQEIAAIREERAHQVDEPRRAAARGGERLAALLADAPARGRDSLGDDVAWLGRLREMATAAILARDQEAEQAEGDAGRARDAAAAALAGFDDAADLQRRLTEQRALGLHATQRIAKAEEQQPKVEALERRIAALRARREALDEVARLLNAGQFVGWLVARRQRHLLAVASEILAGMTGDRYRFAADFTVVDGRSGQPRSPRTLSGGEGFLASLALALGMAELAARSGGRIGSLYLDEGFGSLDPNALDEAIEALEARARAGQMILVISHVPTVAQRIERVLRVTPTPQGSAAEWLDEADRDALLTPAEAA